MDKLSAVENLRLRKQLQLALNQTPETSPITLEDHEGGRFEIERVFSIGTRTSNPAIIVTLRRTR